MAKEKSRADEMTIVEHLVEFRKRTIDRAVLCYIIALISLLY